MFLGICNTVRNKSGKITEIFEQLDHLQNRGVIFLAKKIRPVIVMIWHRLQNQLGYHWFCSWCHILMIPVPILLAKSMTPRLLRCSSCSNILAILRLLFLMVFPKIRKHWSLAVATLEVNTAVWVVSCGKKLEMYWTRPRNPQTSVEFFGVGHCRILSTFEDCAFMPWAEMWWHTFQSNVPD